jgi:hypothetical protein
MTEDELKAARLDDARALEALRICEKRPSGVTFRELAETAARLAREGWTPPVDPDAAAFREWWESKASTHRPRDAYLAGARMAREREQERAKALEGLLREIEPYSNFIPWFDLQNRFDALLKEPTP